MRRCRVLELSKALVLQLERSLISMTAGIIYCMIPPEAVDILRAGS